MKILHLLQPSKHGFAEALIRTVTHDSDTTDTVNYADLTPLGDAWPELMVPRAIDMSISRVGFYKEEGRILSGNIIDVDGVELQVHATVHANKKEHSFVLLYANSKGDPVPKETPPARFKPMIQCVNQSQVLATAPIDKIVVPKSTLSSLRSRGVVMSPIIVDNDDTSPQLESYSNDHISNADSTLDHDDILCVLDDIRNERSAAVPPQHCQHRQEAVVFPVNINMLSGREQIGYM